MGSSSDYKENNDDNNFELLNIPNDQYTCTECNNIPEIISIDYNNGIMRFNCKNHYMKNIDLMKYFQEESKFLYFNIVCDKDKNRIQKDNLSYIFKYFVESEKILCEQCSKGNNSSSIKVNELNCICIEHLKPYNKYCKICNKHLCPDDENECINLIEVKRPNDNDIIIIKNKINYLMRQQKINEYLIKFLSTLITTYEQHPSNYFNSLNITNVAKDINESYLSKINSEKNDENELLLNKIKQLEKKILNVINTKLEVNLTGNEIRINLNGKNVGNLDLELLCSIYFKNLEEIDLSNNNISNINEINNFSKLKKINLSHNQIKDIEPLKKLSLSNLKDINLSYNKIEDIQSLKDIIKNNKNLEKININHNRIKNPEIINEINLDNDNRIKLEFEETYKLLKNNNHFIRYKINPKDSLIKLFDKNFVEKNKEKCKIIIDKNQMDLIEYFEYKNNKEILEVDLIIKENLTDISYMFYECSSLLSINTIPNFNTENVNNMSYLFYRCSSLISINGLSNWQTENVTNMSYMFYGCSSLSSLDDISKWETDNVYNMSFMFSGCSSLSSLKGISNWKTENATNMIYMFSECSSLLTLDGLSKWKTDNINNMSFMFFKCTSLVSLDGLSNWKTNNATNMSFMFSKCSSLTLLKGLSKWQTENVINMSYMFSGCSSLISLEGLSKWKTENVINMSYTFSGCSSLSNLDEVSNWETENAIEMNNIFHGCLKSLIIPPNFSK